MTERHLDRRQVRQRPARGCDAARRRGVRASLLELSSPGALQRMPSLDEAARVHDVADRGVVSAGALRLNPRVDETARNRSMPGGGLASAGAFPLNPRVDEAARNRGVPGSGAGSRAQLLD
jgi:hypothetical protein